MKKIEGKKELQKKQKRKEGEKEVAQQHEEKEERTLK